MEKQKGKKEYYEVIKGIDNNKILMNDMAILAWLAFFVFVLPAIIFIVSAMIMKEMGVAENTAENISKLILIVSVLLSMFIVYAIAKRRNKKGKDLVDPCVKEKYYLNIPDAYTKVPIEDLTDGKVMDELYLNGALCIVGEQEEKRLSYVYNVINDEHDLGGKDLTIYRIRKKDFLSHYTFFENHSLIRGDIYVFPISVLGIDKEEYLRTKQEHEKNPTGYRYLFFELFSDLVDYRDSSYGFINYYYRKAARKYFDSLEAQAKSD